MRCRGCSKIFNIEQIDSHYKACTQPKCACYDCDVSEDAMKKTYKVYGEFRFCSLRCRYAFLIVNELEKASNQSSGVLNAVDPKKFSTIARGAITELLKEPEVRALASVEPSHLSSQMSAETAESYRESKMSGLIPGPSGSSQPISMNGVVKFSWDSEACSEHISLSDNKMRCFLTEAGYCFRSVVGSLGIMGGIAYWEIQIDSRNENELKVGVVARRSFNFNTVRAYNTIGFL